MTSIDYPTIILDDKIKRVFPRESVYKNPDIYDVFVGRNLPSYIKDWMVKCFTDEDIFDQEACIGFINDKIPRKGLGLRKRLLHSRAPIQIFSRLIIQTDLLHGKMGFSIPDLGIGHKEGIVSMNMAQDKIEQLHEGEIWGVLTLTYKAPTPGMNGYVELTDFRPFEPYQVEIDYFLEARGKFTTDEWVDVLIRSMEVNPNYVDPGRGLTFNLARKLTMLSRLLVHVEPNLNMIELAPKGTGKSYVFNNLSKFGWTVSGGIVSRAGIFYNLSTKTPGIIHNYDFLALDEVETIQFSNDEDILGAFKNYLENGKIVVGQYKNVSDCGLMLLGNISLNRQLQPRHEDFFAHLPKFFHSSALVDRIHGFIPGWILFRFTEDLKLRGYALNTEYFSEIMHLLRCQTESGQIVQEALQIPQNADTRDTKAVIKLCTAYMKLLFPHVRSLEEIAPETFKDYILTPALRSRGIIRQQLATMDAEFSPEMPDIKLRKSYLAAT
ncbi:MAG: BREX system Lon protease-like protein BrxL [Candidatus Cloacimonetes bacterium]|nr:BREX system Lon protease-like protein BrxL [Candidatus Cloacimonadota bacterium]